MNKKIYGLLLLSVLFFSVSASALPDKGIAAGKANGKVTLETTDLIVEIVGDTNVPSFFFWATGNDTDKYKISFDQMFEAIDNNNNGIFDLGSDRVVANSYAALAALNWDFSEFALTTDENNVTTAIDFNITSTSNLPNSGAYEVQFRIHMNLANANELKFDVVINNYEFTDANAMLVLSYKMIVANQDKIKAHDNELEFGNAYFQSESKAESGNSTIGVGLSNGEESGSAKLYLAYEHFDGNMVHDPTIGISSDIESSSLPAPSVFIALTAIAVPVLIRKFRM